MSHRTITTFAVICLIVTLLIAPEALAQRGRRGGGGEGGGGPDFSSLRARSVGPALMSGRVGDFAVNPRNPSEYYVAVCSGNVWKTTNAGVTYEPIFDNYGSYSIGCITMDPSNANVLWVGTGENNSQRSVGFGDGVYKSVDGGSSWTNVGLKESEHIGMIAVDPRNSDVVYVAAQGPLWRSGGDRGLYKTTDGGRTWRRILHISDDTGVNEVHLDPRNPDVLYASAYQRRRHVWTLINGGPESGIHKSIDGGQTWRTVNRGLPGGDKGRIGMDVSPADPDVLYAIVEAAGGSGGVYRSTDRGETWQRRSSYMTSSPQYYNEVICDPHDVDRVYFIDTVLQVTEDGGATIGGVPIRGKHVDDHALWIDPNNTDHLLNGCDGGIYETWDRGQSWHFKPNLPVTQFYKAAVDNSAPFYFIYGGTQDNNTQGGPARTLDNRGIPNEEWFITVGGDGFQPRVDPEDPNIVYSESQHGGLVRYDRRTMERVDIRPLEKPGEAPEVWNWDSPLIISPHSHTRIYFAGRRLYRSDDRGDSWKRISEDLIRGIDRNTLKVMGRIQPFDAVAKHNSTSIYGNCVSLAESPKVEGLIYVGTDDGLINVTEDGGQNWRREGLFPGIPDMTYVSYLTASEHDADTVFAAFDNHKMGDFTPYLLKSTDRGQNWVSIAGDLPERNYVHSVQQDHVDPDLLFVGTEFGAYYTMDGGEKWQRIRGVPTIAVMDVQLQRRENDVVLATFGRGFYVLDDYSPLRMPDDDAFSRDAYFFPIKKTLMYIPGGRGGGGSQGASYYTGDNHPYGAVFTYNLKDSLETLEEKRQGRDRRGGDTVAMPTVEELRAEAAEIPPAVYLVIRDASGEIVRRMEVSRRSGLQRITWDLRYPSLGPVSGDGGGGGRFGGRFGGGSGPMVTPGTYTVQLVKRVSGELSDLCEPVSFEIEALELGGLTAPDKAEVLAFNRKAADLQRAVQGTGRALGEASARVSALKTAAERTIGAGPDILKSLHDLETKLYDLQIRLNGDRAPARLGEPDAVSINDRVRTMTGGWYITSPPTQTAREQFDYIAADFEGILEGLRTLVTNDLVPLEQKMEELGAPWTPGRIPAWRKE